MNRLRGTMIGIFVLWLEWLYPSGAYSVTDNNSHRLATNFAVTMLYPKLKGKYGSAVTYEDNPIAHIETDFGFDGLEVAKGRSLRSLKVGGPCTLLSCISRSLPV